MLWIELLEEEFNVVCVWGEVSNNLVGPDYPSLRRGGEKRGC